MQGKLVEQLKSLDAKVSNNASMNTGMTGLADKLAAGESISGKDVGKALVPPQVEGMKSLANGDINMESIGKSGIAGNIMPTGLAGQNFQNFGFMI